MTTKQQPTPWTPYDAEIEKLMAQRESKTVFWRLYAKQNQREGYLRAKAEDADLLAACKALSCPGVSKADMEAHQQLRAAVAKAKGQEGA